MLDHGLTANKVRNSLSIEAVGTTNVVNVSATSRSPSLAAAVANTYSRQFVKEQQVGNQQFASAALAAVNTQLAALSPRQRSGPVGLGLQDRAQSLAILAEVQSGDVQIVQEAGVPTSPSSPDVTRNTLVGAVLGLLLGGGFALWLASLDRTITEPKELEAIYGVPLLGVVPKSSALSRSARRSGGEWAALPPSDAEAFRMVRAQLRFLNVDHDVKTLLVASATSDEGKTTLAAHLAMANATMGTRILLMEADLRRASLAQETGVEPRPGLWDVLIGDAALTETIQSIDAGKRHDGSRAAQLDVLVAGTVRPRNPGKLIESRAMSAMLEEVRSWYDLIIIDTPALMVVADVFPLLNCVDGVLIIARIGVARRDLAEQFRDTLAAADAPVLGVVANCFKTPIHARYGRGYTQSEEVFSDAAPEEASSDAVPEDGASSGIVEPTEASVRSSDPIDRF